jgi:hypothetical protein
MKPLSEAKTKIDIEIKKFLIHKVEVVKIRYQSGEEFKKVVFLLLRLFLTINKTL